MITGTGAAVTVRLRGRLDDLQPKLRRIAEIVLQDPSAASGLSIGALASKAGCSEATVVRFATELGYSGYREFRRNLLHEAAIAHERTSRGELQGDIDPDDDLATVVGKIATSDARAVQDTAQALDIATLAEVAQRISSAPRIT
ncbi:MAG: MurR/RpiR family transcriptional regulator, partial [Brachybacterium sp.]|nr:MurR/RpiR family transcriptional regulator [Brachybacterium sp.]